MNFVMITLATLILSVQGRSLRVVRESRNPLEGIISGQSEMENEIETDSDFLISNDGNFDASSEIVDIGVKADEVELFFGWILPQLLSLNF
ncbi:unnamed protein product [Orchesella dallaii]|uniref:Uncharacterized protein n=1 Tax=Orchesella dallaii TaxID=48710 RepID=A0ABP1QGL5_9HEXA